MYKVKKNNYFIKHMLASLCMGMIGLIIIYGWWYPTPLATATGANKLILMLILIDIIIGPLLGFIVYKEAKKRLNFDLACIIALQLAAFSYGIWHIADGRPAWIVFNTDRFELVRNNEVMQEEQISPKKFIVAWDGPQYVGILPAKKLDQKNNDLFIEVLSGVKLSQFSSRYVELNKLEKYIKKSAKKVEQLKKYNSVDLIQATLYRYPEVKYYLPLTASNRDTSVLLDQYYKIVKIVDLKPW